MPSQTPVDSLPPLVANSVFLLEARKAEETGWWWLSAAGLSSLWEAASVSSHETVVGPVGFCN